MNPDTRTTGPVVTYTYPCAVCGERSTGIGPHCPPKEETTMANPQELKPPVQRLAEIAFDAAQRTRELATFSLWESAARAVAAEVLTDPRRWARELGLPPPRISLPKPAGTLTPQHVNVEQEWDDYTTALEVLNDE